MNFLTRLLYGPPELREKVDPKHPRDPVLADWFGGGGGAVTVTPDTALRITAVYACVGLIAEMIAGLPLHVYRRSDRETAKAKDHPLYSILHDMPTAGMTSFEWREAMVTSTALRGDAFALIETDGAGRVVGLPMVQPGNIRPYRTGAGGVQYEYTPANGGRRILLDDEVLRLPYKMLDGMTSLSPITLHRESIGSTLAATQYLNRFYANNAAPKGGLKLPNAVSNEAAAALRASWEARHAGPENSGRMAIFDGGMEWVSVGMTMEDAQYIELQNFAIRDIARIFLVPPHKIGDLENATFSNIEHQAIQFVTDTLNSWRRRFASRMNAYLLSEADRRAGYYVDFDLKGLLAGDSAARAAFYQSLFYLGALSPNEIRAAEDMNPHPDGDRYFVQGAAMAMDKLDDEPPAPPPFAPPAPQAEKDDDDE